MTFPSRSQPARIGFALAAFCLLTACPRDKEARPELATQTPVAGARPTDPQALIARIESQLRLPSTPYDQAGALSDYTRRYSWTDGTGATSSSGIVHGVLERIGNGPRDAQWVDGPVHGPLDGGCSVITLRYNVAAGRVEEIRCNGSA